MSNDYRMSFGPSQTQNEMFQINTQSQSQLDQDDIFDFKAKQSQNFGSDDDSDGIDIFDMKIDHQKKKDSKQVVQQNTDSDMSYEDCKVNDQEKFLRVSKTHSNDQKQVQLKEGSNSSLTKNIIPDNSSKTSKEGNDSSRN